MKNGKLKKISNFAKQNDISVTWVHKLAEQKKIEIIEIDGVKFVDSEKGIKED